MGKSAPSPPPAPDPGKTAAAQAAANKEAVLESAKVNQINEVTPYGTLSYTGEIGSPERTRIQELTPEGQAQLDQRNKLASQLGEYALTRAKDIPLTPFELPGDPSLPSDFSADRDKVEQAYYDRHMRLIQPELERQQDRLDTRLAVQGLPLGSEAYADEQGIFNTARDQRVADLADRAILAGGAEQNRIYGLDKDARNQRINELLMERGQPINELSALLQGAPATGTPQFGQTAQYQMAPADYMGAAELGYRGQMNNYNQQMANYQSGMGGLYSLGAAGISAFPWSHPDYKEEKAPTDPVLPKVEELKIEEWKYKPFMGMGEGKHIGPYADEFQELFGVGDGVHINPIDAMGVCLKAIKELSAKVASLEAKSGEVA